MRIARRWMVLAAALCSGCVATPLPTPPSADTQRMSLTESRSLPDAVDLRGGPGAIEGELRALRVTSSRAWVEAPVMADGSFEVRELPAAAMDVLFLEAVLDDDDVFLVAVRSNAGGGVSEADPGTDRDADGSPDRIDCAPEDPVLTGRRCPEMCGSEICNGVDDDCDGAIDEGCPDADADGFSPPADCDDGDGAVFPGATERCNGADDDCDGTIDDACSSMCASDADCAAGETCAAGTCTCAAPGTVCGTMCVDLDSDPLHCGGCFIRCGAGMSCVRGVCTA